MKDAVNKEDTSAVTGGAAEAIKETTEEEAVKQKLKTLGIDLCESNLSGGRRPGLSGNYKCPSCHNPRMSIAVLA